MTATDKLIQNYFTKSIIKNDKTPRTFSDARSFLICVIDRIGGYSLGDFEKAMEMAKMNAHSSVWHPAFIVRRSVEFFEDMLNSESNMCQRVLNGFHKTYAKEFLR